MKKLIGMVTTVLLSMAQVCQMLPCRAQSFEDRSFYQRITGHKGSDEAVLLLAASVDEVEGNYSVIQRLKDLQAFYTKHKTKKIAREAWVYSKLAFYETQHGSKDKANSYCDTAIKDLSGRLAEPIDLDSGEFYLEAAESLARALKKLNRMEDFNRICTKLSSGRIYFGREKTQGIISEAVFYFLEGDFDSALARSSDAIKEEPGLASSYYVRALLRMKKEENTAAIKDIEKALAICPDFPHAYLIKGACLLDENKLDEANAALDKALSMAKNFSSFYIIRGVIKAERGDRDGCEADMGEAIKDPDVSWTAYAIRAECYMFHKQYDLAVKDFTSQINLLGFKLNKIKAKAYFRRGTAYLRMQDQAKANDDLKQSVLLDSSRADKVKKLTAKLDVEEEKAADSNEESLAKIAQASDPDLPTFRDGEGKIHKGAFRKSSSKNKGGLKDKPSWIIDAGNGSGSSTVSTNASSEKNAGSGFPDRNASDPVLTSKSAEEAKNIDGTAKSTAVPSIPVVETDEDPYLRYLRKHINSFTESAPSKDLKVTFRIENDGVSTIQEEAGVKPSNLLSNTIQRSAPFRVPPEGKSNLFSAEIKASSLEIKIDYAK